MYRYGRDRHLVSLTETHLTVQDLVYLTKTRGNLAETRGNLAKTGET